MRIKKLVLPVAGMGTRLRPLTLHTPKALIPVAGRPLIEYAITDGYAMGVCEIVLIVSPAHRGAFSSYLRTARKRFPGVDFYLRVQNKPFGIGHALLMAKDLIAREPFFVRFPDDLLISDTSPLAPLASFFKRRRAPMLTLERVPWASIKHYGVVKTEGKEDGGWVRVAGIVEKPNREHREHPPSNLTVIGSYLITPSIFNPLIRLEGVVPSLVDAMNFYVGFYEFFAKGGVAYGWELSGKRFDCGNFNGLRAAADYFLKRGNH